MIETERNQIKGALFKCAEENENKFTILLYQVYAEVQSNESKILKKKMQN